MSKKKCMTVEKLIKALQGMNPKAVVSISPEHLPQDVVEKLFAVLCIIDR